MRGEHIKIDKPLCEYRGSITMETVGDMFSILPNATKETEDEIEKFKEMIVETCKTVEKLDGG